MSTISMNLVFPGAPDAGMASADLMIRVKQVASETGLNGTFIYRSAAKSLAAK
ncbi:hypothetical protein [Rhizobium sp. R634]|uniref:hypothetical protein n=1 Tax=Rhizobium sp. R634 TaxID=1764274 RepID=UPI001FD9CE0A|nr:hypothetical protein [Rhizobium sp. R634]